LQKSRNVLYKAVRKYRNINFEMLLAFGALVFTTFAKINHFLLWNTGSSPSLFGFELIQNCNKLPIIMIDSC